MEGVELFRNIFGVGESSDGPPLMDDDELQLASLVYKVACKEVSKNEDDFDDTDSVLSFDEKVETAKQNLKCVKGHFSKMNRAKRGFLRSYPPWSICRMNTIEKLRAIADAMLADRHNGNIATITGGCAAVLGGGAFIASVVCPIAAPVILPLAIAGGVTSGLGGGVIFGTAVTGIVLNKKNMDEVKSVIAKDKIGFQSMDHWFEHTRELVDAIEDIVGVQLMKEMADHVKKFIVEVKTMKEKSGNYNENFRKVMDKCVKGMCSSGQIQMRFGVEVAPIIMSFIFVVCLMCQKNRFIIECAVITHRLGMGILSVLDVGVQAGKAVGTLIKGGAAAAEALPQVTARAVALAGFAGVGVVIDLANVVLASIDIHKGSLSEEALNIKDIANKLEEEFRFLEQVYLEIVDDHGRRGTS